ncbi:hypothetical protein SESBI_47477 [Sesbania bispinosa]|nr:hypothetical protein SESBI_47477 [Sesbania bispinosa]
MSCIASGTKKMSWRKPLSFAEKRSRASWLCSGFRAAQIKKGRKIPKMGEQGKKEMSLIISPRDCT